MRERFMRKTYATILADGLFHIECDQNDPEAKRRDYELKNGTKGTKFEKEYNKLSGFISDISFNETDYGKMLNITLQDEGEEDTVITTNCESNFGGDLMKKLPNVDFKSRVAFVPFSFNNDKGKNHKGVNIWQDQDGDGKMEKLGNFFYNSEDKKNINGFPNTEGDPKTFDKNDWKVYFIKVNKFLVSYITENIMPKLEVSFDVDQETVDAVTDSLGGQEIDVENIPL